MKKFYFICLSSLFLAACSSEDNEILNTESEIVEAEIGIGMNQPVATRSFLGVINGETVPHLFEANDKIKLIDEVGQFEFTINSDGAETSMRGQWGNPKKYPNSCALFPYGSARGEQPLEVDESTNYPTMHFTLPTSQESRDLSKTSQSKESGISYQKEAGLAFACQDSKNYQINFISAVSFLYFYSSSETCIIESNEGIAGDYDVTYKADAGTNYSETGYSTAGGLWQNNRLSISATSTTIQCKGKKITSHASKVGDNYEYIIALKPGTYAVNHIRIKQSGKTQYFANQKAVTFIPSNVYYLGCVDVEDDEPEIVDAEIDVKVTQSSPDLDSSSEPAATRSFLGVINGETVPHLFEANDKIKLIDEVGQFEFTINSDGAETSMRGRWGNPKKYPNSCALFPYGSARGEQPLEVDESTNYPTMHFTLPISQESRDLSMTSQSKESGISYQKEAGLAFACQDSKNYQINFISAVSFLYFYSSSETCIIESNEGIAGDYDVTYKADAGTNYSETGYSTAGGLWQNNRLSISATSTTIQCKGKKITSHASKVGDNYEYIIALRPGTYAVNHIRIKQAGKTQYFANQKAVTFIPSNVYYLGCVDVE